MKYPKGQSRTFTFIFVILVFLAACQPDDQPSSSLVPFSSQAVGATGLAPNGWPEIEPGTFLRQEEGSAPALLLVDSTPAMSIEYATAYGSLLLNLPDLLQSNGIQKSNGLDWHLFGARSRNPQAEEMPLADIALADDGTSLYTVFLLSPEQEHEELYEEVFIKVVDAFQPLAMEARDQLVYEDMMKAEYSGGGPVNNQYFLPLGEAAPAIMPLEGVLTIPEFQMDTFAHNSDELPRASQSIFPALTISFFSHEDYLVPAVRDIIPANGQQSYWDVIFSPGKIWSESSDRGLSRASFPFLLVADDYNEAHNGLATFLYDDQTVSALFVQIVQETAAWHHTDFWGQVELSYEPKALHNKEQLAADFNDELTGLWPVRPWSELEVGLDSRLMASFVANGNLDDFSATGLVRDRTIYLQGCYTRYGDYPYCQFMRHGIFSVTKSMGAAVSMLRLAQKYGDQVYDLRLADYVDMAVEHDGWLQVTFGDALDMATGIGDHMPSPVEPNAMFGDEDEDKFFEFMQADSRDKKLDIAFTYANYPWGPGQIVRYNSINTFLLSAAMDAFLESMEGQEADIWDMVIDEVYRPIGVFYAPIMRTLEPDGGRGLPIFGYGLFPTVDDVAKVAQLFHDGGRHQGQQLLHPGKLAEALFQAGQQGFPSGIASPDGEVRYGHAFYGLPYNDDAGASYYLPYMSGFGGNVVALHPSGMTVFRFSDGSNYEVYPMIQVADALDEE